MTIWAAEMPNEFFLVDTNVWVARMIADHPFHERAVSKIAQLMASEELLCLSCQIVREIASVCTLGRNLSRPLAWEELQPQLEKLFAQTIFLNETETSARKLIGLGSEHVVKGKQIHDTNLVATMLTYGITRLVTFNPDDFKRFSGIEVIVP